MTEPDGQHGEPWDLLNWGAIAYHGARIFETNRAFVSETGRSQRAHWVW